MDEVGQKRKEPDGPPIHRGTGDCARTGLSYIETASADRDGGQYKRRRVGEPDWITPFCWMCRYSGDQPPPGGAGKKGLLARLVSFAFNGSPEGGGGP